MISAADAVWKSRISHDKSYQQKVLLKAVDAMIVAAASKGESCIRVDDKLINTTIIDTLTKAGYSASIERTDFYLISW
jgi:hypothetical protein